MGYTQYTRVSRRLHLWLSSPRTPNQVVSASLTQSRARSWYRMDSVKPVSRLCSCFTVFVDMRVLFGNDGVLSLLFGSVGVFLVRPLSDFLSVPPKLSCKLASSPLSLRTLLNESFSSLSLRLHQLMHDKINTTCHVKSSKVNLSEPSDDITAEVDEFRCCRWRSARDPLS